MSARSSSASSTSSSASSSSSLSEATVRLVVQQVMRMANRPVTSAAPQQLFSTSTSTLSRPRLNGPTAMHTTAAAAGNPLLETAKGREHSTATNLDFPSGYQRNEVVAVKEEEQADNEVALYRASDTPPARRPIIVKPLAFHSNNNNNSYHHNMTECSSMAAAASYHQARQSSSAPNLPPRGQSFRSSSNTSNHHDNYDQQPQPHAHHSSHAQGAQGRPATAAVIAKPTTAYLFHKSHPSDDRREAALFTAVRVGGRRGEDEDRSAQYDGGASMHSSRLMTPRSPRVQPPSPQKLHERRVERALRVQRDALHEETFTPRIHQAPPTNSSSTIDHVSRSRGSTAAVPLSAKGRWEDRLYTEYLYRQKRREQDATRMSLQMLKELDEEAECTFHPNTRAIHAQKPYSQRFSSNQHYFSSLEDSGADGSGGEVANHASRAQEATDRLYAQAPRVSKDEVRERMEQQAAYEEAKRQRQLEGHANETQLRLFEERKRRDAQRREEQAEADEASRIQGAFTFAIKGVYYETNPPPRYADPGSFQRLYSDHFRRQATLVSAQDAAIRELPKGVPKITARAKATTGRHRNAKSPAARGGPGTPLTPGAAAVGAYVPIRVSRQPSIEKVEGIAPAPTSPPQNQHLTVPGAVQSPLGSNQPRRSVAPLASNPPLVLITSPTPAEPSNTPLRMELLSQQNNFLEGQSAAVDARQMIHNWAAELPHIEISNPSESSPLAAKKRIGGGGGETPTAAAIGSSSHQGSPVFLARTQPRGDRKLNFDE